MKISENEKITAVLCRILINEYEWLKSGVSCFLMPHDKWVLTTQSRLLEQYIYIRSSALATRKHSTSTDKLFMLIWLLIVWGDKQFNFSGCWLKVLNIKCFVAQNFWRRNFVMKRRSTLRIIRSCRGQRKTIHDERLFAGADYSFHSFKRWVMIISHPKFIHPRASKLFVLINYLTSDGVSRASFRSQRWVQTKFFK